MKLVQGRSAYLVAAGCLSLLVLVVFMYQQRKIGISIEATKATERRLKELIKHAEKYRIISDSPVYERYARVYDRVVEYPNGEKFAYDIWGRNWKTNTFSVVIIVPYETRTRTMTLIKEYNPAHDRFVYGFPTGMVSADKHKSPLDAAKQELDEEAELTCNNLIDMLSPSATNGVPQDKYQMERIYMYLCVDEEEDESPSERDSEEVDLHVERGVPVREVKELLLAGTFQSNNMAAAYLALEVLTKMGYSLD
mmetsp:Transcript_36974/g.147501  ORF Transcript_36974/g.147501 Transcript_36974/m.147501 type:complete len:252 (-) Transcript_36974:2667-3422(-)